MDIVNYCNEYINKAAVSSVQRKLLEQEQAELEKKTDALEKDRDKAIRRLCEIKEALDEDKIARTVRNFKLSSDHIKLLKRMEFQYYDGTDLVVIGVDGKRPFGNSDATQDVCEILGWEYPDEDELSPSEYDKKSDAVYRKAWKLIEELPLALHEILKRTKP